MSNFSRRDFLLGSIAAGVMVALGWRQHQSSSEQPADISGDVEQPAAISGRIEQSAAIPLHRVVHTHCNRATDWDYSTGWYGNFVNQSVVDAMTDSGVMALTNTATPADAWHALIPMYTVGQNVAIKINLNNNPAGCGDSGQVIDALPQPINSVIRGLKTIGVPENNIWIYDVTDAHHLGGMPSRLVNKVTAFYPNVQFHSASSTCSIRLGFNSTQNIHFNVPSGQPGISDRPICNALVNASYLINMPIMKKHWGAGVTLAFKNHFGSFSRCNDVHWSVYLGNAAYVSSYSGLIDVYNNFNIKNKTVLTIGDALYGARINNYNEIPSRWPTFGNKSPNSLFFSIDPVAIDCVMYDHLNAEGGVPVKSDDYLKLANAAGLGTFEHWDTAHHYQAIDYERLEVDPSLILYLPFISREN